MHSHGAGHHIEHWSEGGATELSNLVLVCRWLHRLVHEGGFKVETREDGPRFSNRWGDEIREAPEALAVSDDVLERFSNELEGIDSETSFPLWDGARMDHGAAVEAILAGSGRSDPM